MSVQPPTQQSTGPTQDDRTMAMLSHLLGIFFGILGPLIIWLIKKDQSPFVDAHGKESLNFQITLLIAYMVSGVLAIILIGAVLALVVWIASIIFMIQGTIAANSGQDYRYPVSIRFIK